MYEMQHGQQAVALPLECGMISRNALPDASAFLKTKGLRLLLDAYRYAADAGRPAWEFSVELDELKAAGLSVNDFRWMLCKGLVEHATEIPSAEAVRQLIPLDGLVFSGSSCFILTERGADFVIAELFNIGTSPEKGTVPEIAAKVPVWNAKTHELQLEGTLIKQFKQRSPNQERVLCAFQEDGWPLVIDDPLPPQSDDDPKQRLRDTIRNLNRNQRRPLIRFSGDGSGEAICWQATASQCREQRVVK